MTRETVKGMVSVIIPTYNAEAYLSETIESVLQQDWEPLEIIVVDDGSTDHSVEIAKSFGGRVTVLQYSHRGLAATRNSGITAARGEFLLHLDADDLLAPSSIRLRMPYFAADPTPDLVICMFSCFISPEVSAEQFAQYVVPTEPQHGHLSITTIARAAVFETYGLLDEGFPVSADLEWITRAREAGIRIRRIDDVLVKRRIHGNNLTLIRKPEMEVERLRILRMSIARRRKAGIGLPSQ